MNKVQYHHEIMPRCQESDKITQKNLNIHWKPYQDHPVCLRKLKENLPKLSLFGVDFEILDILDLWVFVIPVGDAEYSTGLKIVKIQKFISS